jgi:VWFA-related protein
VIGGLVVGVVFTSAVCGGSAAAQTQQNSGQPQYTIQTRVPITIVDVTVTDAKGKPVHGLKQTDFTVLEDGKEMQPNSFEEQRTDEAAPTAPAPVKQELPPNTFTNTTPTPPKARPLNILLLDSLNTPLQAQQQITQLMLNFVNKMPPGTQMAVFGLSTHLYILQGFTSDRELLKAALTSKKNIAQKSPIEDNGQEPPALEVPTTAEIECDHMASRAQYTLSAMRQIARYLSGMPGRKNLIWFSGSFPPKWPPVGGDRTPGSCYDFTEELTAATGQLADAHIVINLVESRGLEIVSTKRRLDEHYNMDLRADQTGGKAFYNTNGFTEAAQQAIENGSNFYTITYTPTNQALDTRFRTITVKVDQPGLNLTYRNGYYAVEPDTDSRGKKIVKVNAMQAALMRGGLDATQVLFKVKVLQAPGTEAKLPADNQPDAKQMKPPYRRYTISYSIDVHGIDFATSPDGNYRGNFEYGVRVYNADGDEIVNSVSTTISPILPPTVYRSMLRGGANASQQIDVPATGDYFLRIAVHDLASDRVGAIEVPTASIAPQVVPAVAAPK